MPRPSQLCSRLSGPPELEDYNYRLKHLNSSSRPHAASAKPVQDSQSRPVIQWGRTQARYLHGPCDGGRASTATSGRVGYHVPERPRHGSRGTRYPLPGSGRRRTRTVSPIGTTKSSMVRENAEGSPEMDATVQLPTRITPHYPLIIPRTTHSSVTSQLALSRRLLIGSRTTRASPPPDDETEIVCSKDGLAGCLDSPG
jgi:hypothetical protein